MAGSGGAAGAATGAGGAGASGDGGGRLPPCAITTRPQDPVNSWDAGYYQDALSHVCNSIDPSGPWVYAETFTRGDAGDAGAEVDGGLWPAPQGGVVLDGDYELTRLLYPGARELDRRTFRVFDQGTYIEKGVLTQNPPGDGGILDLWYDLTESPSGTNFGSWPACGAVFEDDLYTADGDNLTLYVYFGSQLNGIEVYRRICTRP
jgi:hypothetical protein